MPKVPIARCFRPCLERQASREAASKELTDMAPSWTNAQGLIAARVLEAAAAAPHLCWERFLEGPVAR